MPKFKIKKEFTGMVITAKPFPLNEEITLDTKTVNPEDLQNFWKFQDFRKYIDLIEDSEYVEEKPQVYKGVEHTKKKTKKNAKTQENGTGEPSQEA